MLKINIAEMLIVIPKDGKIYLKVMTDRDCANQIDLTFIYTIDMNCDRYKLQRL